jgi:periplasmic protein TonB
MKHNILIVILLAAFISCSPQKPSIQETPVVETTYTILDEENIVYQFLEEQATFPGGEEALKKYLAENLVYPEEALRKGLEGTVYLQFIVEKDGSLTDITVRHSRATPSMDQAAIEVVMGMPAWNPGRQREIVQRSMYILPIKFVLPVKD